MALIIVPTVLLKPEDTPNLIDFFESDMTETKAAYNKKLIDLTLRSPSIHPRLISLFDEMTENGLFKTFTVQKL